MKHFIPRLLNRLKLIDHINLVSTISLNDTLIKIPVLKRTGYTNLFISEPWMVQLIEKLAAKKKGTFIDVGVNIGQTLIKMQSAISGGMDYIGFEPNPSCVRYTNELIKINNFIDCKIIPAGIADKSRTLDLHFFSDDPSDSCASIIKDFRANQDTVKSTQVQVIGGEELQKLLLNKEVSIIKVDVEGAELEVLQGLKPTIQKSQPAILCEVLPAYDETNTVRITRQESIMALLSELNYSIHRIHKQENNRDVELERIDGFGIHGDLSWCDYVFAPNRVDDPLS